MNAHAMTLRDALSRQKRSVICPKLPFLETKGLWPTVSDRITLWASFNIDNLNESYGHVLDLPMPFGAFQALPSVDELHNISKSGVDGPRQLMAWTDAVVRPVLTYAKRHLRLREGLHDYSGQALVVGISRAALSWRPGFVRNQMVGDFIGNAQGPSSRKAGAPTPLHVQYMPVPWNTEHVEGRCTTLTTEMALWWLCMLALADRPRDLVPADQVVPIDTWVPTLLDDGLTIVDRHYYSNVDRPKTTVTPASLSSVTVLAQTWTSFHLGCR
ncbi:hypothetical protein SCUCBS95973_007839 [Sporothrix curviconia]|uniref:Uncharacterized protein n=1 Tax=Sporothrix curviconia TaxID=1260050 RepID=A0ABP0CI04_9PEZI